MFNILNVSREMSNEEVSKVADEVERRFRVGANVNLVSSDSAKSQLTQSREFGHKFSQNILLDFSTPEEQADVVLGIIEGLNTNWEERSR